MTKHTLAALVLLGAACAGSPPPAGPGALAADAEAAVRARVLELGRAYRDADVAAVGALLADRYIHSNGGSAPGDRADYLRWIRTRAEKLASGAWRIERYEIAELAVAVFGSAAVATGRVTASGMRDGAPWSSDVRFTNLWILERGAWRRAAFHDSASR